MSETAVRIVAGCDGGGTKCAVRIARVGAGASIINIADGVAGGANVATDLDFAIDNIVAATNAAIGKLGLPADTQIDQFVAALAGSTRIDSAKLIERLRPRLRADRVDIVPDVAVLFAAADVSPPALATIVGTGSIAWLQTESGTVLRAGGEGPAIGDLGSGYWIGRTAVETGLIESHSERKLTVANLARLAPRVFAMSKSNATASQHAKATAILQQASHHITDLVAGVFNQWHEGDLDAELPWVVAGGIAVNQREWVDSIYGQCANAGLRVGKPIFVGEPVEGALRMAMVNEKTPPSCFKKRDGGAGTEKRPNVGDDEI